MVKIGEANKIMVNNHCDLKLIYGTKLGLHWQHKKN